VEEWMIMEDDEKRRMLVTVWLAGYSLQTETMRMRKENCDVK